MMRRLWLSLFVIVALAALVRGPLSLATTVRGSGPSSQHWLIASRSDAILAEAEQQGQPPPQQQEEFIPIDQLPPQDQLPAAPLLVTAYSFVVLALFAYVVSIARRLGVVQRELDRLQTDVKRGRT